MRVAGAPESTTQAKDLGCLRSITTEWRERAAEAIALLPRSPCA